MSRLPVCQFHFYYLPCPRENALPRLPKEEPTMTRIIITGAKGRMGKTLLACAPQHREIEVVGQIDQGDDLAAIIPRGDVVIDFSSHAATAAIAGLCAQHQKALVIGTTGHGDSDQSAIRNLQSEIPVVWASNFST